jgi:hypothetical protein
LEFEFVAERPCAEEGKVDEIAEVVPVWLSIGAKEAGLAVEVEVLGILKPPFDSSPFGQIFLFSAIDGAELAGANVFSTVDGLGVLLDRLLEDLIAALNQT